MYIEEHVLCVISMHPANEWMWTPDLGTLQFYSGDTAVMAWFRISVYVKGHNHFETKILMWREAEDAETNYN